MGKIKIKKRPESEEDGKEKRFRSPNRKPYESPIKTTKRHKFPSIVRRPTKAIILALDLLLEKFWNDLEITKIVVDVYNYFPKVEEIRRDLNTGAYHDYGQEYRLYSATRIKEIKSLTLRRKRVNKKVQEILEYQKLKKELLLQMKQKVIEKQRKRKGASNVSI